MPRLAPLPPETTPELKSHFDFFLSTLGFTPNSVLTMQRKPKLVRAFAELNAAVMDPSGEVDLGFRRLVGHVASKAAETSWTCGRPRLARWAWGWAPGCSL